jgi:hypothetical protein
MSTTNVTNFVTNSWVKQEPEDQNFGYPTASELLTIISKTEFENFTQSDWDGFNGCESKEPRIGYHEEFTIVLDGDVINMVHHEDLYGGVLYQLSVA